MVYEKIRLAEAFPALGDSPAHMTVYAPQKSPELRESPRPGIVIFPGGGYEFTSDREAEPVALRFLSLGFSAFVVRYSVSPRRHPAPLLDASAAVALVRRRAQEWNVDPAKIAVCGFSAGGHLAGSVGTLWNEPELAAALGLAPGENRPDAMVLCYPVITSGQKRHGGSFLNLLGEEPDPALLKKLSLENSVGPHTPPAFLWHTADDDCVPCENSLLMAGALKAAGVPFELHLYASGVHGLSLCSAQTDGDGRPGLENQHIRPRLAGWPELCAGWLRETLG